MPFHDWKAAKRRFEIGCTNLADATAHAFDGLVANDNKGFGVSILKADVPRASAIEKFPGELINHGNAWTQQQCFGRVQVRTIKVGGLSIHQLSDPQRITSPVIRYFRFIKSTSKVISCSPESNWSLI